MQKNIPYIIISFGIAAVVCVLSFLDLYDNFEHNLLDMRFKNRGMMDTRDDIATADIDVRALQTEGKWDPWSREKHIPLVNLAAEHRLGAFIFDVYFIEDSERKLEYKVLNNIMEVSKLINKDLPNNSYLMVKGSNSTGLNKIIQNL